MDIERPEPMRCASGKGGTFLILNSGMVCKAVQERQFYPCFWFDVVGENRVCFSPLQNSPAQLQSARITMEDWNQRRETKIASMMEGHILKLRMMR